ncbi:hypothetical protein LPB140_01085 [Sphingorhabdus lutea]|uniref:Uncharacterized protein n=2 Tax=Sphingorhabdus lutea TaxID=1913578 RepID=A0A1L3JEA0_9SPHN|nr:hypothetical protein LPB140_01085 [Sphingorhabdus lutea]
MNDQIDWMARANAKAKGKRPEYFDQPEDDRIYSILMALVGEVSVMRQRLDTVERLLEEKGQISRQDIETYHPDRQAGQERGEMIREYIYRIMRGPMQAVEELQKPDAPVEEVSNLLRDI